MTSTTDSAATAERLLASARQLYSNLHQQLSAELKSMPMELDDERVKGRAETIRSHRRALQTVLDIELQMARDAGKTGLGHELDLESARAEIYDRLDRISAAGRDS